MDVDKYQGLFALVFQPPAEVLSNIQCLPPVVAWLQPFSEYGIFLSWLLCVLCLVFGHRFLEDNQLILDSMCNSLSLPFACSRVCVPVMFYFFVFLCLLVDSLQNNYTPAVLIRDTAISAG